MSAVRTVLISLARVFAALRQAQGPCFCLTATEASEAGPLAGPFPSRQAGNRQVAISLARVMLFRAGTKAGFNKQMKS